MEVGIYPIKKALAIAEEQGLQIKSPSVSLKNLSNIDAKVVGSLFSAKNNKENISLPQ